MVIAALCVIGLLALVARAVRVRKSLYLYDIKADSVYDFSRTGAREIVAQVNNGKLPLPPKARPGDSIFVAVRIRATLFGHWFEPRLEIDAEGQQLTQAFERGGAGLRYLNLSSLDVSRETTVRLDGKFLHIADQAATLYYISNDLDLDQQRILLLSPHPDDAEIAAFGLYSNRDAYVVTVTAGEGGGPGYLGSFAVFGGGANAYFEKGKTRAWNSVTVPMLGGVSAQRTANLGYFDETLQAMRRQPTLPVTSPHTGAESLDAFGQAASAQFILPRAGRRATWNNLVEDLVYVIENVDPDIIVAPYPLLDGHPDHKMSTAALLDALRKLNRKRGSLLLYTNHSVSSLCYPYGPAGDVVSLPPGGSGVLFDGLLSTPLNLDQQQRKRVALDAMNDLRPGFPAASPAVALRQLLRTLRTALSADDQSYFRRAVRHNELFFEVRAASLAEPGTTAAILGTVLQRTTDHGVAQVG
jgi:LmbE family N-acetylglucosaminyl deacetylase